jgi:hypothetical protein
VLRAGTHAAQTLAKCTVNHEGQTADPDYPKGGEASQKLLNRITGYVRGHQDVGPNSQRPTLSSAPCHVNPTSVDN